MPYVIVKRDPEKVPLQEISQLGRSIPEIVAKHLKVAGEPLSPEDISMYFEDFGRDDVHHRDVQIVVQANFYPERAAGLESKAYFIAREIHESSVSGLPSLSVWIQLFSGGYFETK